MSLFRKSQPVRRHVRDQEEDRAANSMSYYSRRSEQSVTTGRQQPREKRRPLPGSVRKFWIQRFGLIILGIAIAASAFDILSLSNQSRVEIVGASRLQPLHNQAVYQAAANSYLGGSVWNRNKITVNTAGLSSSLKKQFPELSNVSVTIPPLAHQPIVYIEPDQPAILLTKSTGSYLVDQLGKDLLSVPDPKAYADLNLPQVLDQSNIPADQGKPIMAGTTVTFVETVVAQLTAKQVSITSLTLPNGGAELDAAISGEPYSVKFNLQSGDARQQAGTFLATQARLNSEHITPQQYIDVRVEGRAYYK